MHLDVRRCLILGLSTALLCGPTALIGVGSPLGAAVAQAQEAAPEEAESPRKRRRTRDAKGAAKGAAKPVTAPGMQQATPVAIFGDWNVFASGQGRTRVCYAIAQPTTRSPKTLKRDTAYLFVTVRKAENVQNEVAVMLGFPARPAGSQAGAAAKPGAAATDPAIHLGATRYGLVTKDNNTWLQNQAEEARVVTEMTRTAKLQVRTTSLRGNPTSDEYALAGFNEAMKRTRDECK